MAKFVRVGAIVKNHLKNGPDKQLVIATATHQVTALGQLLELLLHHFRAATGLGGLKI